MINLSRYRKYYKSFLLILIFAMLLISITRNLIGIHAVSSTHQYVCVPIIMYHHVKNTGLGKNSISPAEFESDLKYLTDNEYNTITMTQLIDYVYNDAELPPNPIILSFDDGHYSTYKYVYPLLKKYNAKIVLSIIGKSVDNFSRVNDINIEYSAMTWDQVYEMVNSGCAEIQNHTYDLHKIKNGRYGCYKKASESLSQYEQVLTEDVSMLQDRVMSYIDSSPNTFTYPFGKYNDSTENIIKKIGFKATLSCTYGINLIEKNPEKLYGLKRIGRAHNQSVQKLIKDAMKTLKYVGD